MFEAGMVTSRNIVTTKTRWTLALSLALQGALLATLILIPLFHPELLHISSIPPEHPPIFVPPLHVPVTQMMQTTSTTPSMPRLVNIATNAAPRLPSPFAHPASDAPVIAISSFNNMSTDAVPGLGTCTSNCGNVTGPAPKPRGPMHISGGVMEGRLVRPIQPIYPAIAKATRTQGTVVIAATIGTDGTILNAHVVSGSPILAGAAIEAVERARYQPFKLSGVPVEVDTTINVVFTLD